MPVLALCAASLFWAGNVVVARALHAEIPPVAMAFWRWTVAGVLLAPAALRAWRTDRALIGQHWRRLALLGVVGAGVFNTLCYLALRYTQAINGAVFNSMVPVFILVLGTLGFGLQVRTAQVAGVAVSCLGVLAIIARGEPANLLALHFNVGDLLFLVAMVLWSLYTLMLRGRPAQLRGSAFLGVLVSFALPPLALGYAGELAAGQHMQVTAHTVLALLYLGTCPSVLAFLCYNYGVERLGAARAGVFVHLVPVFGLLLSTVMLGEAVHAFHLVGMALILAGVHQASR